MDDIPGCTDSCNSWTAADYTVKFYREITAILGNTITLDLPLTQAIASEYGGGRVCACACKFWKQTQKKLFLCMPDASVLR